MKRSEDKTSTVLIVIHGLQGQERGQRIPLHSLKLEITKGRRDLDRSCCITHTQSAVDARTYCVHAEAPHTGKANAERGKEYIAISTRQPPLLLSCSPRKSATISIKILHYKTAIKIITSRRYCPRNIQPLPQARFNHNTLVSWHTVAYVVPWRTNTFPSRTFSIVPTRCGVPPPDHELEMNGNEILKTSRQNSQDAISAASLYAPGARVPDTLHPDGSDEH